MAHKPPPIKPKLFQCDLDEETYSIYSKDDHLAVDCEMMGLNPRRDRLCLVQMCDSSNNFSVIQIVPDQKDAPRLKSLFENPEITKVFHYGRMDMCFLKAHLNINLKNLFCTKIASKLARTYTDKHGLKDVIREFFSENMDKKNQSSDWGKKILSKDQLEYACEDVRYLISLAQIFTGMLVREGRLELAQNCFAAIPTMVDLDILELKDVLEH
ncbi:MAG: ribonuclease D [Leptospiraceae bacterium]|nr:ribonuclease D [Leptospiraceae bacterium]MCP5498163.1 ribonuclease D [Leptospiraceae bacterium]